MTKWFSFTSDDLEAVCKDFGSYTKKIREHSNFELSLSQMPDVSLISS